MINRLVLLILLMPVFLLAFPSIGNGLCSFPAQEKQAHDAIIGDWEMETEFQGNSIPAIMTLSIKDGQLVGIWVSMDQEMEMMDLEFDGKKLSFKRTMGEGGETIDFEGIVEGDEISGKYLSPMGGEYKCTGRRKGSE